MNFKEKIIDKNAAELCYDYDRIRGANINLARITPDIIDGLKPVQRRALYIMSLKDGGKNFRKLASISGDTFGRVHPHSPTSISDAVVNMAQSWVNNIPLIEGKGNWGTCHDDKTEVLTLEGFKLFKDITKNDLLATMDPESFEMKYEHPTNIIEYYYEGDMITGYYPGIIDFRVTPNHTMIIYDINGNYSRVEAKDLPESFSIINSASYNLSTWDAHKVKISRNKDIIVDEYIGYVYCAEVPTYHTLITRRNNRVLFSGNCAGDPASAERYIYARLSDYCQACFFEDWKYSVVDMVMGYDEETKEPLYLPAKYPNVLLNGCLGIGYGLSANLPPFNFKEICTACIQLMNNPKANIILIPDSPSGASIIEGNFAKMTNFGGGKYKMRCTYEIDDEKNIIRITSLPYKIVVNDVRERIADIKEKGGLSELVDMHDLSGIDVNIQLFIRDDVNPYKFMKKLISSVSGLEQSYPVCITVVNNYKNYDLSLRDALLLWIDWRRDQKRTVLANKRTVLFSEQRINDIKLFMLNKDNLDDTIKIYRTGKNRTEIEKELLKRYKDSSIHMDSIQARTLSGLRMIDLSRDAYESYLEKAKEIEKSLNEVETILNTPNGIDKTIIDELKDGIKRFGAPRRSNVVSENIQIGTKVGKPCILQLSSDGNITRKLTTNVYEEPVPLDNNGFAVRVEDDSAFIVIDENGYHSFIKVIEIPLDSEVPINRFMKKQLTGKIVAMLPVDIESDMCCTLISKFGNMKKLRISEMVPSKRPCMIIHAKDAIVKGINTLSKSKKDLLIYTKNGYGQRFDPNLIRITSPTAKGTNGFKLKGDDEIVGAYSINPEENQYILYVTSKGKMRLNRLEFLEVRESKHDAMVSLISLNNRDKLVSVVGCNKNDKVQVFFDTGETEIINIKDMEESTMGTDPVKMTKTNAVASNIVKVKLL